MGVQCSLKGVGESWTPPSNNSITIRYFFIHKGFNNYWEKGPSIGRLDETKLFIIKLYRFPELKKKYLNCLRN